MLRSAVAAQDAAPHHPASSSRHVIRASTGLMVRSRSVTGVRGHDVS